MPVRIQIADTLPDRDEIVARLAQEIRAASDAPFGQPLVLVSATDSTRSARITVIWDEWKRVARELRGDLITEAVRASGEFADYDVTLALGMTFQEATVAGLLPYEVVPRGEDLDPATLDDYRRVAESLGAHVSVLDGAPHLRLEALEDAKAACVQLESALPGSKWLVVHHVEPLVSF